MPLSLGALVAALGGELHGDPATVIDGIAALAEATPTQLSFVTGARYREQLLRTRAACVIADAELAPLARAQGACIVTSQPYLYYARPTHRSC